MTRSRARDWLIDAVTGGRLSDGRGRLHLYPRLGPQEWPLVGAVVPRAIAGSARERMWALNRERLGARKQLAYRYVLPGALGALGGGVVFPFMSRRLLNAFGGGDTVASFLAGLLVMMLTVLVIIVPIVTRLVRALLGPDLRDAVLGHGRCPGCIYEIRALTPEADGCVVCPECGGAWRVEGNGVGNRPTG